jgi:hypothetical protein
MTNSNQTTVEFLTELVNSQNSQIETLTAKLSALRKSTKDHKIYKALATEGTIYVNTYSQDCDGVESYNSLSCTSIEDYHESEESFSDSIEGRCSWEIVSKEDITSPEDCGTFGAGWGIN